MVKLVRIRSVNSHRASLKGSSVTFNSVLTPMLSTVMRLGCISMHHSACTRVLANLIHCMTSGCLFGFVFAVDLHKRIHRGNGGPEHLSLVQQVKPSMQDKGTSGPQKRVQVMERRLDQQRQQLTEQHTHALQLQEQRAAVLTDEKLKMQRREAEAATQQLEERLSAEVQRATKVRQPNTSVSMTVQDCVYFCTHMLKNKLIAILLMHSEAKSICSVGHGSLTIAWFAKYIVSQGSK